MTDEEGILDARPQFTEFLRKMGGLLTPSQFRQAAGVAAVILVGGLLELIGVGSILPFLDLLMNPESIYTNSLLSWGYTTFGFSDTSTFLMATGVGVLVIVVGVNLYSAFSFWVRTRFTEELVRSLSTRLLDRYIRHPYPYFIRRNTADLRKNVLNDSATLVGGTVQPAIVLASRATGALFIFGMLVWIEPVITLVLVALFSTVYGGIYLRIKKKMARIGQETVEANEERFRVVQEGFDGIKEVKLHRSEQFFMDRYAEPTRRRAKHKVTQSLLSGLPKYLIQAVTFGGLMAITLFFIAAGTPPESIVPVMGLFAFAGYRLLPAIQEILNSFTQFKFNEHLLNVIHRDLTEGPPGAAESAPEPQPLERAIRLEDVTFSYANSQNPVLEGLTLEIPKGTSVAFVGETGAGKTTIVDILTGLLPPDEGSLVVDGRELRGEDLAGWRESIGYVPQEIYLRDDTIARNIAYALPDEQIDLDQVEDAAKIAQLHDFIETLPEGYQTTVGERGVRLSGGQRQRLGLARAIYRDPAVLVLDEATSDIDNVTQEKIAEAIREMSGDKTVITIAHRLSTIQEADTIHLIEDGQITASGSYQELLKESSTFRELNTLVQA